MSRKLRGKELQRLALDYLVGRTSELYGTYDSKSCDSDGKLLWKITLSIYSEEEQQKVISLAQTIRVRKANRGILKLKRTYAKYNSKPDNKTCSRCYPCSMSTKYVNKGGWVDRRRLNNVKYIILTFY